ncbi:peptidase S9B dipeptidylpeptidase IV domain protein [Candidatus Vecturithrix granuli]|uniref:Peptidase S9B dipeptidylpeptidase IV domain protein n=1 Tax=Vecturithrix granuli TaxID=1499967 RepID=A0A0S6W6B5_VECG1|nr:peptidase S9B dipeptidylpeptidase IV domain protein [Candidatus Vecturithrix granuli]
MRKKIIVLWGIIFTLLLLAGLESSIEAQLTSYFGKNKVHYKDFKWATLKTTHFMIYFYSGEEQLARNTAKMAERAYQHLSTALQHEFTEKIPLICYASSDDFQQTEIISGFIGEGIGGVTESLRGRIVIPFLGSYRYFNHVLIHELVHAFQFDILREAGFGGGIFSSGLYVPLWFMEGMPEYLSEYRNPLTEMWLRDAVYNDTLPKINQIEDIEDIRAYRFGQSLWQHLGEMYGESLPGDLLRELAKTGNWQEAIKNVKDTTWKAVYRDWLEDVQKTYAAENEGRRPIEEQAVRLIAHKKDDFALNILPAVSPDGKYIALISDRDVYRTIYLASAETGKIIRPLVEGERRGTFETLRFLNTSLAWDSESQHLAFNAKAGGENAIYVMNVHSEKVIKKLVPAVASISFLAWSPDRRSIVFTGTQNGQEDLYLINIDDQRLVQLTNDLYSNRHPSWSPDGKAIAFTTDSGQFSDPEELKFGPSNLALYEMASGNVYRLADNAYNDFTPVWSPDGSSLAFISDRDGVCNIYLLALKNTPDASRKYRIDAITQVTNVNTGIVGLTEDNPALTWAQETGKLFFSGFADKGWDIFALDNPLKDTQTPLTAHEPGELIEKLSLSESLTSFGKKDWKHPLTFKKVPEPKKYRARLQPEYIFGGGGGNDKNLVILARLGLSDMLSNHRLTLGLNLTEVFDESDFLIQYSNRASRLSYEIHGFQFGDSYGTYSLKDAEFEVEVQRGIGVNFHWPFDKFRRVELGLEGWMVSGEKLEDTTREELEDQFFAVPTLAYVHDTTLYTSFGPLDGRRSRYSLSPAFGDFLYLTAAADQRWYIQATKRSTLALRMLTAVSVGENARIFNISGPYTFRSGAFDTDEEEEIEGTKIALANLEYRFPLLPKLNLLRGNVFWDMALGWTDNVRPLTTEQTSFIRLKDLRAAYGIGVRVPISGPFGSILLRFDMTQETDLTKNIGERKWLFSLGQDF